MKNEEKVFILFLLLLTAGMAVMSLDFSFKSRLLPFSSAVVAAAMLLFLLLLSFRPKLAEWYARHEKEALTTVEEFTEEEKKKELIIFAWFLGGVALVFLAGFLVAIPLFLFLFLRLHARESWLLSLVLPLCVGAIVYGAFVFILRVPLESGLLFG